MICTKTVTKALIPLFAVLAVLVILSACGQKEQTEDMVADEKNDNTDPITGGWELTKNDAASLPEDVQEAFDKATEKHTGSELIPVAYVSEQIVAGTNHMILCEAKTTTAEPATSYQMIVIYADLEGNAELTEVKDFELSAYTEAGDEITDFEQIVGGWAVPEDAVGSPIPKEARTAFNKAAEPLKEKEIEPLALLGTQVVAGTNYAFICKSKGTSHEQGPQIQIVVVYEDLEENGTITNTCTFDPASR